MKIIKNFFTIMGLIAVLLLEVYLINMTCDNLGLTTIVHSVLNMYTMPAILAMGMGLFVIINGLVARCIPMSKLDESGKLHDIVYVARLGLSNILHIIISIAVTAYAILAVGYILFVTIYNVIAPYFKAYEGEFAVGYLLVVGALLVSILSAIDNKR